jgi:cysteine desulfuration protein SufE
MPGLAELEAILAELDLFPDRQEKIEVLISIADEFQNRTSEIVPRTESNKVPGCESEVFVVCQPLESGGLNLMFAVDNPQGLSAMVMARILEKCFSGKQAFEIAEVDEAIVFRIFGNELSMGKNLGLTNMIKMIKALAIAASRK